MGIAQDLRRSIDQAYRELIVCTCDGDVDHDECIATLANAQRSPEQFERDLNRLRARREAAEQLAQAEMIARQFDASRQKVHSARQAVEKATGRVAAAKAATKQVNGDTLENRRVLRLAQVDEVCARDEAKEHSHALERLLQACDRQRWTRCGKRHAPTAIR